MYLLELEFAICFKVSDLDKHYSLDSLTAKVMERMQKANGNRMALRQRKERKEHYLLEVLLLLIWFLICSGFGWNWFALIITALFARVFYWIYSARRFEAQHIKKLDRRLSGKAG